MFSLILFIKIHKDYEKGKQYNSFKELECNIYTEWDSIDPDYLKHFVARMPNRMAKCLTMKKVLITINLKSNC